MKKHKKIIQIIVAIVLVYALIVQISWQEVWQLVQAMDGLYVSLFLVFYVVGVFLSARKWQLLGEAAKFDKNYSFYLKSYFVGTFLNNFFPSFIGGDTYRTVSLGKSDQELSKASTTVIMDRISGLLMIAFLAIFLSGFSGIIFDVGFSVVISGLLAIIFLGVVFNARRIVRVIPAPEMIKKYIENFSVFNQKKVLCAIFGYSSIFAFVGIALANYMLFVSLDIDISVSQYISVVFFTNIIASLPISIGNIGIKEWAYIAVFGLFGVGSSVLVTIVILSRILQMLVSLFAVPIYFQSKKALIDNPSEF